MTSLYFFGDSICFGQFVSTDRVWTTRVSRYLSESIEYSDVLTQVTAVNGETSREALGRIQHCVTSHSPDLVWIQFGLNDSNFWRTDLGNPRVTLAGYLSNIEEMIQRCLISGSKKILLATNHVVTKRLEHEPDSNKYQENAKRYNDALREKFGPQTNQELEIVDVESAMAARFKNNENQYLLPDGVHLNLEGHEEYLQIALKPILSSLHDLVGHG